MQTARGAQDKARTVALTVAGFDPSGGAGVIADLRTFAVLNCYGMAAVSALTFQNRKGVFGAVPQTAAVVRDQIMPILAEYDVSAAKTGMLPSSEVIAEVARLFRETSLPAPVVDPVISATSGYVFLDNQALELLITELLPLARLVTPNVPEAERLAGIAVTDEQGMREAAKKIREKGARAVLIKGGHLFADAAAVGGNANGTEASHYLSEAVDVLDDGGRVHVFRSERLISGEIHGTGCVLAAAIAAGLAQGMVLEDSVRRAKEFVTEIIRHGGPRSKNRSPSESNSPAA